jgi:hypothetical protein
LVLAHHARSSGTPATTVSFMTGNA